MIFLVCMNLWLKLCLILKRRNNRCKALLLSIKTKRPTYKSLISNLTTFMRNQEMKTGPQYVSATPMQKINLIKTKKLMTLLKMIWKSQNRRNKIVHMIILLNKKLKHFKNYNQRSIKMKRKNWMSFLKRHHLKKKKQETLKAQTEINSEAHNSMTSKRSE